MNQQSKLVQTKIFVEYLSNMYLRKISVIDSKFFNHQIKDRLKEKNKTLSVEHCHSGRYPSIEVYKTGLVICIPDTKISVTYLKAICVYLCMILWGEYKVGSTTKGKNGVIFKMMYKTYFNKNPSNMNIDIYTNC